MRQETPAPSVRVTEQDRAAAAATLRRTVRGLVPLCLALQFGAVLGAGAVVARVAPDLEGMRFAVALACLSVGVLAPVVVVIAHWASTRSEDRLAESLARERVLASDSTRREFEARLGQALDMAATEEDVLSVAGRALQTITGDDRVEILVADNSHAHLERALVAGSDPLGPNCPVPSPDQCVAARRGQTQVFPDSRALDACPHLQGRAHGHSSAVCVPVSITGRTTGVVHWAATAPAELEPAAVAQLEVLATQTGARLGMLRIVSESQLQATTDPLTGLLNRRAFEHQVKALQRKGVDYTVVMGDLDHFKDLNDRHGHDTGDRALRIFVGALRATLRPSDLACRYGGEEFVVALPECDGEAATKVCDRFREALAMALLDGGAPSFTASFGIAPARPAATLQELVTEADAALYRAKREGRNRSVVHLPGTAPAGPRAPHGALPAAPTAVEPRP